MNNDNKLHYLVYQITNNINGMIYVGKHQTKNINDSYMGSGIYIIRAIKLYGVQNFTKTILFDFDDPIKMDDKEKEIVNEEFVARSDTYNIALGGFGGGAKSANISGENNQNYGKICITNVKTCENKMIFPTDIIPEGWIKGKTYSTKTKIILHEKLSKAHKGLNLGKVWITNIETGENKYIEKTEDVPIGWKYGCTMILKPTSRIKTANRSKNSCWITNEQTKETKFILKSELDIYLNNGWIKGNKLNVNFQKWNTGNMWISNKKLKISKTIPKNEIIPSGWIKGRLFYSNGKSTK